VSGFHGGMSGAEEEEGSSSVSFADAGGDGSGNSARLQTRSWRNGIRTLNPRSDLLVGRHRRCMNHWLLPRRGIARLSRWSRLKGNS
jgi:hypothetical protein